MVDALGQKKARLHQNLGLLEIDSLETLQDLGSSRMSAPEMMRNLGFSR